MSWLYRDDLDFHPRIAGETGDLDAGAGRVRRAEALTVQRVEFSVPIEICEKDRRLHNVREACVSTCEFCFDGIDGGHDFLLKAAAPLADPA